jgi:hypothetical protein
MNGFIAVAELKHTQAFAEIGYSMLPARRCERRPVDHEKMEWLWKAKVHCLRSGPGSFGSPTIDSLDGILAVFGEVFEALDRLEAEPAQNR